jgi:hypothetical protein
MRLAVLGTLAGLGYCLDLGAGPPFFVGLLALVVYRCRSAQAAVVFVLSAVPWIALHHGINLWIGGTLWPANAVAEYFEWPGSPFHARNLTGFWNHRSFGRFLAYAAELLVGKRGFIGHNLALCLAIAGPVALWRRRPQEWAEMLWAGLWCVATWALYAISSSNYSGVCCSVRWFVPCLAPGYFLLAVLLRQCPRFRPDFLILSAWGLVLGILMWSKGPWMNRMVPGYWVIEAGALACWLSYRAMRLRQLQWRAPARREVSELPLHSDCRWADG